MIVKDGWWTYDKKNVLPDNIEIHRDVHLSYRSNICGKMVHWVYPHSKLRPTKDVLIVQNPRRAHLWNPTVQLGIGPYYGS